MTEAAELMEPRLRDLPDPERPVYGVRSLSACVAEGKGKSSFRCLPVTEVEVLLNGRLYLSRQDQMGLRRGQVLSRNLKKGERAGVDPDDRGAERFLIYDGVYRALRGIGHIRPRYECVEVPRIQGHQETLRWLMHTAWDLREHNPQLELLYSTRAKEEAVKHRAVEDEGKVVARDRTAAAASLVDRRGRRNTTRLPPMLWSADLLLKERRRLIRGKGRKMDVRVIALAHYIDSLMHMCQKIDDAAIERLGSAYIFGSKRTPRSLRRAAVRMRDYAARLSLFTARPFHRVLGHVARDLRETAEALEAAADARSEEPLVRARQRLGAIHRSMVLMRVHRRLEETLVTVSRCVHLRTDIDQPIVDSLREQISSIRSDFAAQDPLTREVLDHGFRNRIVARVLIELDGALELLSDPVSEDGCDLKPVKSFLDNATLPI